MLACQLKKILETIPDDFEVKILKPRDVSLDDPAMLLDIDYVDYMVELGSVSRYAFIVMKDIDSNKEK